jgi:hypothetical protein
VVCALVARIGCDADPLTPAAIARANDGRTVPQVDCLSQIKRKSLLNSIPF